MQHLVADEEEGDVDEEAPDNEHRLRYVNQRLPRKWSKVGRGKVKKWKGNMILCFMFGISILNNMLSTRTNRIRHAWKVRGPGENF